MAVYSGPKVVTDGMVLHLDKYNEESYLGEPTVNLMTNPVFQNQTAGSNAAVGWGTGFSGTDNYIEKDSLTPVGDLYFGLQSTTPNVYQSHTTITNLVASTTYTISYWVKTSTAHGAVNNAIYVYGNTNGAKVAPVYATTTEWQKKYHVFTTFSTTQDYQINSYNYVHDFTVWISGIQIEEKGHYTKFVDGTRPTADNWRDLSGNDYHADVSNQVYSATNVPGTNVNNFPASSSGYLEDVNVYSSADMPLGNEPRTLEAWFSKTNSSASNDIKIIYGWGDSAVSGGHCYLAHYNEKPFFWGYSAADLPGTTTLTNDVMYHMVATWDGYTKRIYLNAVQEATDTAAMATVESRSYFYLGRYTYGSPRRNEGYLDVVRVYDRALSAIEVLQNYNASKGRYGL